MSKSSIELYEELAEKINEYLPENIETLKGIINDPATDYKTKVSAMRVINSCYEKMQKYIREKSVK